MATLLYRLGRFSFRRRGRTAAVWLLLLILLGGGAATLMGPTSDKFSMPGTESQRALEDLDRQFPQAGGATGVIVVAAPEGAKLAPAAVAPLVKEAAGVTVVIALAGLSVVGIPFLSVMGLAAAGTVAVAVLVALTLLPAFLSFAGRKILPRKQRHADKTAAEDATAVKDGTPTKDRIATEGFGFTWGSSPGCASRSSSSASSDWARSASRPRTCASPCRTRARPPKAPPHARRTT